MNNIIKKVALSLAALMLVISVSYAFVKGSTKASSHKALTDWYFTGNSSQIHDAGFWTTTDPNNPDCGQGTDLPCDVSVDASNSTQLQAYLNANSTTQIKNDANSLRPE